MLVTEAGWRWVFCVNVPVGILAVIFGTLYLQRTAEARPADDGYATVIIRPGR